MKTIYKIAKTELQTLFFSPVAWLILVIFTFQVGILYSGIYSAMVRRESLGWQNYYITMNTFAGMQGLFTIVQGYLFLYIPLLTMGVMSREFASGSIKLLYSSPITNSQIILGKFLSLMIYGLVLVGILGVFGAYSYFTVEAVDTRVILCGLLGLYLLICAYSAIGLYMSSLTSYVVVAAMGTLAIFALMNYVKGVGQEIEFVRDITYWFSISGRSDTFISGLITSDDVLYFLIVMGLFLGLSIFKLQAGRQKNSWMVRFSKYAVLIAGAALLGYFTSKPKFMAYYDATRNKNNTLTKSSQEVVSKLTDGLTITTYTNMLEPNYYLALPASYKYDVDRFKRYLRFKPEIKLKYKYYYHKADNEQLDKEYPTLNAKQRMDTLNKIQNFNFDIVPYKDVEKEVNLEPERFRFVRLLKRDNGNKTFLRIFDDNQRFPSEAEITAAFKRLVMKLPVVGFLKGQGERGSDDPKDRGYKMIAQEKTFRYALINQGFDFKDVELDKDIPDDIRILVIAEMKKSLTPEENERLNRYIERGGNLIIAGEPGRQEFMNEITEPLGVEFLPGRIVKPSDKFASDLIIQKPSNEAAEFSYYLKYMQKRESLLVMPSAGALSYNEDKGFKVTTLFTSDTTGSWNELETTNFIDDSVRFNPAAGEIEKPYPTVLALSRKVNNKEQKILITGDADWLSNGELGMTRKDVDEGNFYLINTAFYWESDGEVPIDMRRDPPLDKKLTIGESGWAISDIMLKWVFPALLILAGLLIWIRRRGR
ncbi:MAG: Gldg family protein [Ginsengibacter sp.]